MSDNDLRKAIYDIVPRLDYLTRYEGAQPPDSDKPPWLILTVSLGISDVSQARQVSSHLATLEARIAALTPEQADMAAMALLDEVTGARPDIEGYVCGTLNKTSDSETYSANDSGGIISPITAASYSVRVIRWTFLWSRL